MPAAFFGGAAAEGEGAEMVGEELLASVARFEAALESWAAR